VPPTLSTTYQPARDLGYLLHEHPARMQEFSLLFGRVHVFYPEAGDALWRSSRFSATDLTVRVQGVVATALFGMDPM